MGDKGPHAEGEHKGEDEDPGWCFLRFDFLHVDLKSFLGGKAAPEGLLPTFE